MKTSNIIITSLVGSITLIILASFLQLRLTGAKKSQYAEQVYSAVDLAAFKYLLIRESLNVSIIPSHNTARLVIRNARGQEKPIVDYRQKGETLFIDRVKFGRNDRTLTVTIHVPDGELQWIKASGAMFAIHD